MILTMTARRRLDRVAEAEAKDVIFEDDFADHREQKRQNAIGNEHALLVDVTALKDDVTLLADHPVLIEPSLACNGLSRPIEIHPPFPDVLKMDDRPSFDR